MGLITISVTNTMLCMALNIYHESRGEPVQGQYAVAHVVITRAELMKKRQCEVILEKKQFSWVPSNTGVKNGFFKVSRSLIPGKDDASWVMAKRIAEASEHNPLSKPTITHFHKNNVNPKWAKKMEYVFTVGKHKFYFDKELGV